jgi:prefoldin subunit 5
MQKEMVKLMDELKQLQQEIKLTQEVFTTLNQHIRQSANCKTS